MPYQEQCQRMVLFHYHCGHTRFTATHAPGCPMHASYEPSNLFSYIASFLLPRRCWRPNISFFYDIENVCLVKCFQDPRDEDIFPIRDPQDFTPQQLHERRVRFWFQYMQESRRHELCEFFGNQEKKRQRQAATGVPLHLQTHVLDSDGLADPTCTSLFYPVRNSREICPICMEDMIWGKVVSLPCEGRHEFHYNCVLPWILRNERDQTPKMCPYCRCVIKTVSKKDLPRDEVRFAFMEELLQGGDVDPGSDYLLE